MSQSQIPVAVLGATGSVGQRFMSLLDNHPWFKVVALAASDRSVGQKYSDAARWVLNEPMPEYARDMIVVPATPDSVQAKIVFSALHNEIAKDLEPQFARAGAAVCSNASSYRREEDVPLLLPEVNAEHIQLVKFNANSAAGADVSSRIQIARAQVSRSHSRHWMMPSA